MHTFFYIVYGDLGDGVRDHRCAMIKRSGVNDSCYECWCFFCH